jgi:hypothetical protein
MPLRIRPVCPHCSSRKLTFLEHGSGVSVFQCDDCARATVQQWEHTPAAAPKPATDAFRFPAWFTRHP